jgi:predicted PP-loop superfamily ATPase
MLFIAAAALIFWLLYQRMSQSKEIQHDGSTLVKDMKSVYSDSKCVCKDARQMGMDMIDETMQMKDDLTKDVKDVKDQLCGCEKSNEKS